MRNVFDDLQTPVPILTQALYLLSHLGPTPRPKPKQKPVRVSSSLFQLKGFIRQAPHLTVEGCQADFMDHILYDQQKQSQLQDMDFLSRSPVLRSITYEQVIGYLSWRLVRRLDPQCFVAPEQAAKDRFFEAWRLREKHRRNKQPGTKPTAPEVIFPVPGIAIDVLFLVVILVCCAVALGIGYIGARLGCLLLKACWKILIYLIWSAALLVIRLLMGILGVAH